MQAIHDNGYMHKGSYEGWYCVSCEAYYPEADLLDGRPLPGARAPRGMAHGGELVLRAVPFRAAAARVVREPSRRHLPRLPAQRGARDHQGRPPGHLDHADLDRLGRARPVGRRRTSSTSGTTPSSTTSPPSATARTPSASPTWWPAVHHLLGKDIIRFHCVWWPAMCLAAGIDPPAHFIVHGWLLVGGEKMSKTRLNQIDPVELAADIGVDALRYHLVREVALGRRRGLHLRRARSRGTTRTSRTISATCSRGSRPSSRASAAGSGRLRGRRRPASG